MQIPANHLIKDAALETEAAACPSKTYLNTSEPFLNMATCVVYSTFQSNKQQAAWSDKRLHFIVL